MKKIYFLIFLLLLSASVAQARGRGLSGRAGSYAVEVVIEHDPPIVGDNRIEISLKDGNGHQVSGAQILVNYYMPPMPRMAPMNYTIPAKLKGVTYSATLHLIMDGPWIIALKINQGGETSTAKFHINAR
jgi:hypothetical protein